MSAFDCTARGLIAQGRARTARDPSVDRLARGLNRGRIATLVAASLPTL